MTPPSSALGQGSRCACISSTPQLRGNAFLSDDDAFPLRPVVCLDTLPPQLRRHIKGLLAMTQHVQTHTHAHTYLDA